MRIYDKVKIRKHMHLYIITDGESYKIGIAKNINNRLKNLQTSNPKKLSVYRDVIIPEPQSRYIEKCVHDRLKEYRLQGEWFSRDCLLVIDKMSDSEICNINNYTASDDGIFLYEIYGSEYGDFLRKHKLFYNDEGYLEFSDKRHGNNHKSLSGIINNLDEINGNHVYTLNKDKVPMYLRIIINGTMKNLQNKIVKYQNILDGFNQRAENIKRHWGNYVEEE